MFWNFISSIPVKRGGSLSFLVGTITNVLVMEIGWTDVGSEVYILMSCDDGRRTKSDGNSSHGLKVRWAKKKGCTRIAAASDEVYQLLAHGWWFSPASSTNNLSWIFIVLSRGNNSPQKDMSLHSDTLFWFRANQSLLFLLNAAWSPWYSWNIAESGVKHQKSNQIKCCV
jgi:hypothetical protein